MNFSRGANSSRPHTWLVDTKLWTQTGFFFFLVGDICLMWSKFQSACCVDLVAKTHCVPENCRGLFKNCGGLELLAPLNVSISLENFVNILIVICSVCCIKKEETRLEGCSFWGGKLNEGYFVQRKKSIVSGFSKDLENGEEESFFFF